MEDCIVLRLHVFARRRDRRANHHRPTDQNPPYSMWFAARKLKHPIHQVAPPVARMRHQAARTALSARNRLTSTFTLHRMWCTHLAYWIFNLSRVVLSHCRKMLWTGQGLFSVNSANGREVRGCQESFRCLSRHEITIFAEILYCYCIFGLVAENLVGKVLMIHVWKWL